MSSSTQVQKLPKPQLRGLLASNLKKHMTIAFVLAFGAAAAFKVLVVDARRQRYADFYKTYDAKADYERMKALGYFEKEEY